ncbi:MAG: hypothetical protein R2774_01470 [Saprospiraceae bacterium]
MKVEYFFNDFDNLSFTKNKGSRRKVTLDENNKSDTEVVVKLNEQYDFFQLTISSLMPNDSKRLHLKFKNQFSKDSIKYIERFNVGNLDKSFYICLVQGSFQAKSNISRILGINKDSKVLVENFIGQISEKVLNIGLSNGYSILNPNDLNDLPFKVLVIKKYLSNKPFEIFELIENEFDWLYFPV